MSISAIDSNDNALKILVIDETPIRRAILETGLKEAGFANVMTLDTANGLIERIYALDPDVILIDLDNPSRDVLEQMFQVSRAVRRPIAMFVEQSDKATIEAAIDAGVSAYIVDGLKTPGAHDDVANAVAGALVTAFKEPGVSNFNRKLEYPELSIV